MYANSVCLVSLAERNLRAEDSAGDTVLAPHPHNLDLPRRAPDAKDRTYLTEANFANILEVPQGLTTMPRVSSYMSSKPHVYLDPLTSVPVEDRLALVQAALIHPHVSKLPECSLLEIKKCEGNERRRRRRGRPQLAAHSQAAQYRVRPPRSLQGSQDTGMHKTIKRWLHGCVLSVIAEPVKTSREMVARWMPATGYAFDDSATLRKSPVMSLSGELFDTSSVFQSRERR